MIYDRKNAAAVTAANVARQMASAAITAPKGCGIDNVDVMILDGADKDSLADHMRDIGQEINAQFFVRDAENVYQSQCILLIGVKDRPIQLADCGICGFDNCEKNREAGANCAFNITDLGIAVGAAVSVAADNRIDNRVMYSAGKAAIRMRCFSDEVRVCYGIPLSIEAKSIFFDRSPGAVLL